MGAVAAVLAGCGGSAPPRAAPPPRLPHVLATQLAGEADAVAASIDAGDACAAQQHASALQQAAIAAVPQIPAVLRENLLGGVNDLVSRLPACTPPPAPPPTSPPGHHGQGDGHDQGGQNQGEG